MPDRTGSDWGGRRPRPPTLRKSGNCTAPASANPKSLAGYRSGAHHSDESWEHGYEKTETRSGPGRPHPQRGDRRCASGRAGNELVLLSGKQDPFPVPGTVSHREGSLAAPEG